MKRFSFEVRFCDRRDVPGAARTLAILGIKYELDPKRADDSVYARVKGETELNDDELFDWLEDIICPLGGRVNNWTGEEYAGPELCAACGADTEHEFYMVHDTVWGAAAELGDAFLCIVCLERRLGRTLTPQDFTDAPVNAPSPADTPRLRNRRGQD
jgi:hypothetical protein